LSVDHAIAALAFVPRNFALRAIVLAGILAPWAWVVAIDRILRRKR
jgi:hypothetical protein